MRLWFARLRIQCIQNIRQCARVFFFLLYFLFIRARLSNEPTEPRILFCSSKLKNVRSFRVMEYDRNVHCFSIIHFRITMRNLSHGVPHSQNLFKNVGFKIVGSLKFGSHLVSVFRPIWRGNCILFHDTYCSFQQDINLNDRFFSTNLKHSFVNKNL